MRLALLAPRFPPDLCGVGDHSSRLAHALSKEGNEVIVWTARSKAVADGLDVRVVPGPWGPADLARISRDVSRAKPDAVVLQYTPYLYSESGGLANWLVPPWIVALKALSRVPVAVVAHELHYPVNATVAGVVRGLPQAQIFLALAVAADQVFFTYEAPWKRFQKLLAWRASRLHWLPVGANIEPTGAKAARVKPDRDLLLLHFGGAHPTQQLDWVLAAFEMVLEQDALAGRARLVFIGASKQKIESELRSRPALAERVSALGELAAPEVSKWLKRADLVLAPFSDGVSTRRSSVMAALAHGRAVLSTQGTSTDADVPWHKACRLVASDAPEKFARATIELLLSEPKRKKYADFGAQLYEECFAWPGIAQVLTSSLERKT